MSYKIVVMSCDRNEDLWLPFHHCMEKYWKDHPEIIYSTETKINPYYKTITCNLPVSSWTKRVYETIKDLECRHILLLVDDIFLRDYVDSKNVNKVCYYLIDNVVAFNFEPSFDKGDIPLNNDVLIRNPFGKFKLSCMAQMWRKRYMLDLFNTHKNPWAFEKENKAKCYVYLISKKGDILNWGRKKNDWRFGVVKNKWAKECKEFFDKEGLDIDYSIRGFWGEEN